MLFLFKYQLSAKVKDGSVIKLGSNDCHRLKSVAGRLFHSPTIDEVKVKARFGKTYLFLSKELPTLNMSVPSPT